MMSFSGCDKSSIYKTQDVPESIKAVKTSEMQEDVFYIKDGTRFYQVYLPDSSFTDAASIPNPKSRYVWNTQKEDELIPTLYKNETICFVSSKSTITTSINIERFVDLGYSIGICSMEKEERGYAVFSEQDTKINSSAGDIVSRIDGDTSKINIAQMDQGKIPKLSKLGTFMDLSKGDTHSFTFYVGTRSGTASLDVDTHFFQSSEVITLKDISDTHLDYVQIKMPKELKSGYYYIGSSGMFRYIADEKVDIKDSYDYNLANDFNDVVRALDDVTEDSIDIRTVPFAGEKLDHVTFALTSDENCTISEGVVITPTGKEYKMKLENNRAEVTIENVKSGEFTVKVKGKNPSQVILNYEESIVPEETPEPEAIVPTETPTPEPTETPEPESTETVTPEPEQEPQQEQQTITTYEEPSYEYEEPSYEYQDEVTNESYPLDGVEQSGTLPG